MGWGDFGRLLNHIELQHFDIFGRKKTLLIVARLVANFEGHIELAVLGAGGHGYSKKTGCALGKHRNLWFRSRRPEFDLLWLGKPCCRGPYGGRPSSNFD